MANSVYQAGQIVYQDYQESETFNATTTYQTKCSFTADLEPGNYKLLVSFSWGISSTSNSFAARVLRGSNIVFDFEQEAKDTDDYPAGSQTIPFTVVNQTGAEAWSLDWARVGGAGTARIKKAYLEISRA